MMTQLQRTQRCGASSLRDFLKTVQAADSSWPPRPPPEPAACQRRCVARIECTAAELPRSVCNAAWATSNDQSPAYIRQPVEPQHHLYVDSCGGKAPPAVTRCRRPAIGAPAGSVRRAPVHQRGVRLDQQPSQAHLQAECGCAPVPAPHQHRKTRDTLESVFSAAAACL